MFGRRRIAELEAVRANLRATYLNSENDLRNAQNKIAFLVRTIQQMDEQIYKMSQCSNWDSMSSHFNNLQEGMLVRKRTESDRIADLIHWFNQVAEDWKQVMSEYPTYETKGGQADEAATYARLCEHLRLAAECCYVLGHLRKANDDEVIGSGFLGIGQMLEKVVSQVTKLATGSKLKWN